MPELVVADMRDPLRMQRYNLRDYIETQVEMKAAERDDIDVSSTADGGASSSRAKGESSADYLAKEDPITGSTMRNFLEAFKRGELTKSLFSEENRDSDVAAVLGGEKEGMVKGSGGKGRKLYVKPLVGSNFRKKVIGPDSSVALHEQPTNKDIFVYVHAPWCGHCKSFEPVIEELAKLYRRDDNLKFYRIDGSRNEIDHDKVRVRGFPALFLFPAGDKDHPVEYVGERDAGSIAKFLKSFRNSVNSQHEQKFRRAEEKRKKKEYIQEEPQGRSRDSSGTDDEDGENSEAKREEL